MHDPREHLALAVRHVAEAEVRIALQRARLKGAFSPDGARAAHTLLRLMEETLGLMIRRRECCRPKP
jgi:hypothetical protein